MIQTVTGNIQKNELGRCLAHQHIVEGAPGWDNILGANQQPYCFMDESVQVLTDARERFGLQTIVDATTADRGRNPQFLKEVSQRSGVNVIASTGYYTEKAGASNYFAVRMRFGNAEQEVYDMMHADITKGMRGTDIKAGVIKVATGYGEITPYEDMFLRVAAAVSRDTGCAIISHTERGTMHLEQAKRLKEYGASPDRIMIGHLNNCDNIDELMQLAEEGVYLGFDRMGLVGLSGITPENRRLALITGLAAAGYSDRIVLAHDSIIRMLGSSLEYPAETAKRLKDWNFVHIFENILPALQKMGVSEEITESFVNANPARLLDM